MLPNKFSPNVLVPFKDPFEMLCFYDPDIREGTVRLYDWQIKILRSFARDRLSFEEKIHEALVANNGSGKSQFILAPCILWIPTMFDYGFSYVTSASAFQLDTQTERYVDYLIDNINKTHKETVGADCWKRVKREKTNFLTNGKVDLIATDEKGKAEGKHPLKPNSEFAIFVDEAKSVTPEIFSALNRCTGYTRKMYVSSPGDQIGEFYDVCSRKELGWLPNHVYKVTYLNTPHITHTEVEQAIIKYGLHDPWVRSAFFAEFSSVGNKTVITIETLNSLERLIQASMEAGTIEKLRIPIGEHSGLDLSAGGDEIVLSVWKDNFQIAQETGRYVNTIQGTKEIIHWIQKHHLDATKIWADDGGIGRGIIDNLHDRGYKVRRVLNQHRAFDSTRYANRGVELWFNFKRFLEEGQAFPILTDLSLKSQLTNRYYKTQQTSNKLLLESKEQAKANGHPSPDRADAAVLAWANFSYPISNDKLTAKVNSSIFDDDDIVPVENMEAHYRRIRLQRFGLVDEGGKSLVHYVEPSKLHNSPLSQNDVVAKMLRNIEVNKIGKLDKSLVKNRKDI